MNKNIVCVCFGGRIELKRQMWNLCIWGTVNESALLKRNKGNEKFGMVAKLENNKCFKSQSEEFGFKSN